MKVLIQKYIALFTHLLFPPRKTEYIVARETNESIVRQSAFQSCVNNYNRLFACSSYQNHVIRACIWELKYFKNKHAIQLLGTLLHVGIQKEILPRIKEVDVPVIIAAIPSSSRRIKERGYNHIKLLAEYVCSLHTERLLSVDVLQKIKHTPAQSSYKRRSERLTNIRDCFVAHEEIVRGRDIIVIDDVTTTGATMLEAYRALTKVGARSVHCIAVSSQPLT